MHCAAILTIRRCSMDGPRSLLPRLGAEATVIRDPSPDGGVIATLDDRRVSYTLTALADHEMARLADKVGCAVDVNAGTGRVERDQRTGRASHRSRFCEPLRSGRGGRPATTGRGGEPRRRPRGGPGVRIHRRSAGSVSRRGRRGNRCTHGWARAFSVACSTDSSARSMRRRRSCCLGPSAQIGRAAGRLPRVSKVGDEVHAGDVLGTIGGGSVEHRVMVPPGCAGKLTWIAAGRRRAHRHRCRNRWRYRCSAGHDLAGAASSTVLERIPDRVPFVTGQRVLDLLAPIAKGSSATVVGGFGEGKTMLLEQVVKWGDADVIIYVGCGERGNELADLIGELRGLEDPRTGRVAERTNSDHREHVEHAGDGPGGEHLHRGDRRRVLPRHGICDGGHRRFDVEMGRSAARALLAHRCHPRRGGISPGPTRCARRVLRPRRSSTHSERQRRERDDRDLGVAPGRRPDRARNSAYRAVRASRVGARP